MDLQNNNGAHAQNGTATVPNNKAAQNAAKKEAAENKPETKPIPAKDEKPEMTPEKPKAEIAKPEKLTVEAQQPQAGIVPVKQGLTLEAKLKTVNELHHKSLQRINLIKRMNQLEAFEVAQVTDELEDNPYQGCTLIIRDDKGREFVTSSPGLICLVGQFIFNACDAKKAEIEKSIVFPNF